MTTDTKAFTAGLTKATSELRAFGKIGATIANNSAFVSVGAGLFSVARGAEQVSRNMIGLTGRVGLAAVGLKGFSGAFTGFFKETKQGITRLIGGFALLGGGIAKGLAGGLGAINKAGTAAIGIIGSLAKQFVVLGVGLAVGAIAGMYKLIEIAGKMEQQIHRADITFGAFSGIVIGESKKMADAFGIPREEFIRGATALGALFKAEGYSQEQAAKLSTGFTKLAIDASRLTGIPVEEVMEKITKGAAGATKGLKDLGIYINDNVIKDEALKMGLVSLGQELSETAKIQARLSLIQKGLADATGQTGATANSAMGRWEAFTGRIANLAETVATILLPLIGPGSEMQVALYGIQTLLDGVGESMLASTSKVVGGAGVQASSIGIIQKSVGFLANAWQVLKIGFMNVQVAVTFGIKKIVDGLGSLSGSFDVLLETFGAGKTGATEFLTSFGDELQNTINSEVADLDKAMKAPWSSEKVDDFVDNAKQKLADLQKQAANPAFDLKTIGAPAKIAALADKHSEIKFSSALEKGSAESTNSILRSQFGGGDKSLQSIAGNTQKSADHLQAIKNIIDKLPGGTSTVWMDFQ